MELSEFIKTPMINDVILRRPFKLPLEGTLCITGHHLILSKRSGDEEEIWVSALALERNVGNVLLHSFLLLIF